MSRPQEHSPEGLGFHGFDPAGFPLGLGVTKQVQYLRCYLADLGAGSVLEEPQYFDRDYLAEFSAFYASSARGYLNTCRRLSIFTLDVGQLRRTLGSALAGDPAAHRSLQDAFLGFVVLRPTAATPFGRTVLRWYPERSPDLPRVTAPSRDYRIHVAGLVLRVHGLAWQEQDTAVGACATVALWAMFHASARDDYHAIPTTAEVTRAANRRWPLATRVFPASDGLSIYQVCEAIRGQGLQPSVLEGDQELTVQTKRMNTFSPFRFASTCAALIRSGYPVLLAVRGVTRDQAAAGILNGNGHAVCAVGFRSALPAEVPPGLACEEDATVQYLYVHDDCLGPNVRVAVRSVLAGDDDSSPMVATLWPEAPEAILRSPTLPDPSVAASVLVPTAIVAALPEEISLSSDRLYHRGLEIAASLSAELKLRSEVLPQALPGLSFSARFFRLRDYLGDELGSRLSGRPLSKARFALTCRVRPMSLHLGVVRLAIGGVPLADVLFDTTDSEAQDSPFCTVVFQPGISAAIDAFGWGPCVRAT